VACEADRWPAEGGIFVSMYKQKRKLSPAQKAEKKKRQKEYMTIFVNGKQKRVKRTVTIDGMDVNEFIRRNADSIWLHQNEMWEYMDPPEDDVLF
jgi:16S rRNA U516 pseudouridylate synthase RsuA-like enzyme